MNPFEFIILFLSFIYTLALTHLMFAWTRMIRHRRQLTFSWPHLLWMIVALGNLTANWISLWDFRTAGSLSLGTIAVGFFFVIINYFVCALVSPDFDEGETYDMKHFHRCEGPTYVTAILVLIVASVAANFIAGTEAGVKNWGNENVLVTTFLFPPMLALTVKREWVQVIAPVLMVVGIVAYDIIFYPQLTP